jgi:hypothetical protein
VIAYREDGLALSGTVLRALQAFTVKDTHKPNAECIAIESGDVCASDGASAVRFVFRAGEGPSLRQHEGSAWSMEAVERAVTRAREASEGRFQLDERAVVVLPWQEARQGWYALSSVEPKDGVNLTEGVTIDPELFSRLELVARACRRLPDKGEKASDPVTPNARLLSAAGPYDALRWAVGDEEYCLPQHQAFVSIMPCRPQSALQRKLAARARAELKKAEKKPKRAPKKAKASEAMES